MSAEQHVSIDIIDTFTSEQKKQWEAVAPFFENGRKITLSTFFEPGEAKEIFIDCLEEDFMGTIIRGTFEGNLNSLRTPEEMKNNRDNYSAIAQAMIANGSAQINVDLSCS